MLELLWLLLPAAAASGWIAARRSADTASRRPPERDPAYFRGLNYLLDEQPDKAIDVFVRMLEVDGETVETHLALGSLFRRRGEVERAIRIHQNLIARPTLSREQRAQALLDLGLDYMRAGLFDRAENLFLELRDTKLLQEQALEGLRVIYQQEKDWEKCLQVAEDLESIGGRPLGLERAHYYCELAELARAAGEEDRAHAMLKKALGASKDLSRAIWLQAALEIAAGDYKAGARLLNRIAEQDPDLVPEVLPQLVECHRRLGQRRELVALLEGLLASRGEPAVLLMLADVVQEDEGEPAALRYVAQHLGPRPSLASLLRLIRLAERAPNAVVPDLMPVLRDAVERLLERRPAYQCAHCGFNAKTLHWQCPGCRRWSTIKPVRDLDH
ncbi:MAG: lipopolysaccharide assembly protein LapB [Gammaproteobacteria bacterium]|jgi:lipopolysaccharide biosynthesis regulator YciM|nr:lipopolysaccharide assembly protein LapB [Gammaproteobacteria bacterium]